MNQSMDGPRLVIVGAGVAGLAAGCYAAGQWVESWGGITTAAQSGRNAVRALCRRDGARFAY